MSTATVSMSVWITRVDRLRKSDELLARGDWHAYKESELVRSGADPMRGAYFIVRWARPTVAISSDEPDECVRLARQIESALLTAS